MIMVGLMRLGIVAFLSGLTTGLILSAPAFGQAPLKVAPVSSPGSLATALHETLQTRVLIDQPGDGATWARGLTYKARFDANGFTYIPFLGSSVPRNYPVQFAIADVKVGGVALRLDALAAPSVNGTRITYDRGGLREIYDLQPTSVEQTFEIDPELRRSAAEV